MYYIINYANCIFFQVIHHFVDTVACSVQLIFFEMITGKLVVRDGCQKKQPPRSREYRHPIGSGEFVQWIFV
jgi:hypothetical protein